MSTRTGMFGTVKDRSDRKPGGGCFPTRPHYPHHVAQALHALAESQPPWPEYLRERARILEANR